MVAPAPSAGCFRREDIVPIVTVVVVVAAVYAATLCPTVYWYDSAEFAAHAAGLGVPHPPGYPLYTLIAHAFTWLPGEAALDVNLMSLVFGVLSCVLAFVLTRGIGVGVMGAWVGAVTLALLPSFWTNAVVAEVYTPGLAFTLGTFVLLCEGLGRRRRGLVVAAALLAGAGVGVHMSIATCGLAYVWLVLSYGVELPSLRAVPDIVRPPWTERIRIALACLLAAAAGLCTFIYIPIVRFDRWDDPTQWRAFYLNATGGQFKRKFLDDYDWVERTGLVSGIVVDNLGWVGVSLAVFGLAWLVARRPRWGIALVLGAGGNLWWFFNYAVPDLDVFMIPALALGCLGVAVSVDAVGQWASRWHPRAALVGWLGSLLAVASLRAHWSDMDLSQATDAKQYGTAVCDRLPDDAVLIHRSKPEEWRRYSVILYMQKGLGRCTEVEIMNRPKHRELREMLRRGVPVYAFLDLPWVAKRYRLERQGEVWAVNLKRPKRWAPAKKKRAEAK